MCNEMKKAEYAESKRQASITVLDDMKLLVNGQGNNHDHNDEMKM